MPTNKPFVASKKQLHRLTCIVSLLKRSDDGTADKIIGELRGAEQDTGISLGTGAKTVYRDMQTLREEYKCPVGYDPRRACYTLPDKQWSFPVPTLLNDTEILAVIIGAKFAEKLFAPEIADQISRAAAQIMQTNSTGSTAANRMDSLQILSTKVVRVTNKHFPAVFNAWSQCRCLDMKYKDTHGKVGGRIIEPHGLVYYGTNWYILAYCREAKDRRLFNVSRILGATIEDDTFTPREDIIDSFTVDEMLIFSKMRDIVITLTATGAKFARAHMLHPEQKLAKQKDGSYKLTAPAANEKHAVSWVLQQAGEAIPQEPELLVTAVKEAVKKLSSLS